MTIKTNANCKLLAKCSRLSPPFTALPPRCPSARQPRTAHAMAATAACCIFLQSLFVHGHKLRAGRPALATYYDQFGAAHTHVQHSHTKRSRHCVEARANTLLLLYLVGAGAQQALQVAARRLVSLLLLLLLLLARPTSCARERDSHGLHHSQRTQRHTHFWQARTHYAMRQLVTCPAVMTLHTGRLQRGCAALPACCTCWLQNEAT